ncbi:MAG TPA: DUF2892 domain-containing protein [Burkholderiaceae bacterium]
MIKNVGSIDSLIRVSLGAVLIVATLLDHIGPWGWLGLVPLLTGLVGVCPAYLPFGLSTCARRTKR